MKKWWLLVLLFVLLSSFVSALLTDDIISFWDLSVDSVDSLGVFNGSDTSISYDGVSAYCDGLTSGIQLGSTNESTSFTWSGWFNTNGTPSNASNILFSRWPGTDSERRALRWEAGNNQLVLYLAGGTWQDVNVTVPDEWIHVVYIQTGGRLQVYLNNVSVVNVTSSVVAPSEPSAFCQFTSGSGNFRGWITSWGLWSGELDNDEISQLFAAGKDFKYPFLPDSHFLLMAADNYGGSINVFNVTFNGTSYNTSNGVVNTSILKNASFAFNMSFVAPNYFSSYNASVNLSSDHTQGFVQSQVFFNAFEKVSNNLIQNFSVNDSTFSSSTSNFSASLFLLNGSTTISFVSSEGYVNSSLVVNVSPLDNLTVNFTGLYDSFVNLSAVSFALNGTRLPVYNLSGNITAASYPSFFESFNSSSNFAHVNLSSGVNYSFFMTSPNYTTSHASNTIVSNVSRGVSLVNFTLFRDRSLLIRFRDIVTGNNLSGVQLFLFGGSNFNFTVDSEAFLFPFAVGSYDLLATLANFNSFSSTISVVNGGLVNITAFMNNNTQDVSFIVRDLSGAFVQSARVEITRASDGASIGSKITDVFGGVDFGLNEDISYNINVTRSGFTPFLGSLNAFQSSYTITLSTPSGNEQSFIDLSYNFLPVAGSVLVNDTSYNFSFNISSGGYWGLSSCNFYVYNNSFSGAVLASNSSFCSLTSGFSGFLTVNSSNSNFLVVRADIGLNDTNNISVFRVYSVVNSFQGRFTFMTLVDDLQGFSGAAFNSAALFFLVVIVIVALTFGLGKQLNVFGEPEKMLLFVTLLVGLASYLELLTVSFTPDVFPEAGQWIIFIVMGLLTIASFISSGNWRLS